MKNLYSFIAIILTIGYADAQTILTTSQNYDNLKQSGQLDPKVKYKFINSQANVATKTTLNDADLTLSLAAKTNANGSCECLVPVDPTFTIVPMFSNIETISPPNYRNDDGSSLSIPLGFNFCFYGTTYNSCFINNNGNISFVNDLTAFSAGGFPAGNPNNLDTIIIAPFWGDVDTRNLASGLVYFKKTATSMIVKWSNVGYYNSMANLKNDFQLIITDGTDPLLPNGNNVAFCYGEMQWTTGSASNGIGGFGGTPATVGVNKGDDINFIQIGRFNINSSVYDGPYGLNDGIDFLDNKSYFFNTCGTNNNLPPIIQDATGGGSACGDTIRICALGDTLVYTTSFLAPENSQSITVNGSAPTLGGSFIPLGTTTSTAGITTYAWMVVANPGVTGVHTVLVTGTDNGVPPLSSTATYFIKIQNLVVPQPTITISPSGSICATPGATVSLANCAAFDNIYWSNGSSGCTTIANSTGVLFVTVSKLGCYKSTNDTVNIFPNPIPVIFGALSYCAPATSTTLSLNPPTLGMPAYATYTWATPATNGASAIFTGGVKTVTVTDVNGCRGSAIFTITAGSPTVSIASNPTSLCAGLNNTLTASINGANSYSWSTGAITQSITVNLAGVYSVTVNVNNCTAVRSITINPKPTIAIPNTLGLCSGASSVLVTPTITPAGNYSYNWSNGSTSPSPSVNTATTISVQITNNTTGCISLASNICTVVVAANPTVALSPAPIVFCNGFNATLTPTITGGLATYNYSWTPSAGSAPSATVNTPGTYSVLVTDANNCKGTATVSVLRSSPTVSITSPDLILCPGDCAILTAVGTSSYTPYTYSWAGSSITNSVIVICGPTTSSVTFTDAKGCISNTTIATVNDIIPNASFTASPSSPVTPGQVITYTNTSTIASGTITSSSWNFGDGTGASTFNTSNSYPGANTYTVTLIVTGSSGCKDTASMVYVVDAILNIPNVITPNGDGKNDFLKFANLEVFSSNHLTILNRWGNKIYDVDSYKNDWNGGGQTDGTYFFILTVPGATPNAYNGYFQIIR